MSIAYLGETWSKDGYTGFMLRNGLSLSFLLWLIFPNPIRTGIVRALAHPSLRFSIRFFLIASSCSCSSFSSCVTAWAFAKLSTAMAKNTFSSVSERSLVREGNFAWIKRSTWRKFCYSARCLTSLDVGYQSNINNWKKAISGTSTECFFDHWIPGLDGRLVFYFYHNINHLMAFHINLYS